MHRTHGVSWGLAEKQPQRLHCFVCAAGATIFRSAGKSGGPLLHYTLHRLTLFLKRIFDRSKNKNVCLHMSPDTDGQANLCFGVVSFYYAIALVPKMTPAGLEPAIPGSVGRCLIHWATGPLDNTARLT